MIGARSKGWLKVWILVSRAASAADTGIVTVIISRLGDTSASVAPAEVK